MNHQKIGAVLLVAAALWAAPALAFADDPVGIILTEAPPSVTASRATTTAGATDFAVENVGAIGHELVIARTDLADDALPTAGDVVDLGQLDIIVDSDTFAAGTSGTVAADLTAGDYVLFCNIPGHYGLGMHTAFTVAAGDAPAAPAPAAAGNAGLATAAGSSSLGLMAVSGLVLTLLVGGTALLRRGVRQR